MCDERRESWFGGLVGRLVGWFVVVVVVVVIVVVLAEVQCGEQSDRDR